MIEVFLSEFPEVIAEKPFGRYRVDAYLPPPYHLAFEADGDFWHPYVERQRPGYYKQRDDFLLERFGLLVVRLTETEIKRAVWGRWDPKCK
jgi:very-short-patch-repair endonuclease